MELEFHQISMKYKDMRIESSGVSSRLISCLAKDGQQYPVTVVEVVNERPKYVLIDGYRRVSALRSLYKDSVNALVLPMSETAALFYRYCNQDIRKKSALEDGWLFRELIECHGIKQAELSRRLGKSESFVSRRLSMVQALPESLCELVRRGVVCDHAAMKYLVPLARAKIINCEILAKNLSGHHFSSREIERLYEAVKISDAVTRARIVEQPTLFLKTQTESMQDEIDSEFGKETKRILKDIEILSAISNRVWRRLLDFNEMSMSKMFCDSWQHALSSFLALKNTIERRTDVG